MPRTEQGLLISLHSESRRLVQGGMQLQGLSSASSALNFFSLLLRTVGVTGIPPLQGSLLLRNIATIRQSGRICGNQSGNAEAYAFVFEYIICIQAEAFCAITFSSHKRFCSHKERSRPKTGKKSYEWFSDYLNRNRST